MQRLQAGRPLPEPESHPDAGLTNATRKRRATRNPIHTDPEFAESVGLAWVILHGLYSMAQAARAHTEAAAGDPRALKRLSVQFRGMGFPAGDRRHDNRPGGRNGRLVTDTVAAQGDNRIIRNAEAELELH